MAPDDQPRSSYRLQSLARSAGALGRLVAAWDQRELNEFEQAGAIQLFEVSFELAWKYLKDRLKEQGRDSVGGPREVIRLAFEDGLIADAEPWMEALQARNTVAHLYGGDLAADILQAIRRRHAGLLQAFVQGLSA